MRVAYITRSTLYTVPGGDGVQVLATAKYLRRQGVDVDIRLSTDKIDYSTYDLLHFFNIIRPADILKHIRSGKPYVVSPIFVDYSGYDKTQRRGLAGKVFRQLPANFIEYMKTIARFAAGNDTIVSPEYLWLGQEKSIRRILQGAACILPNSENEYQRLRTAYGIDKSYMVVPNGIDEEIFPAPTPGNMKDPAMVICAARIEGIKNQLNLIRALNNTRFNLYLIGNSSPNQKKYYRACKKVAAANIDFINNLPQSGGLAHYYRRATVHVLPSWFETTGLSSLEAAAMGCNIVIGNRGDSREYFGESAFYCDPASPDSIYQAVEKAAASTPDPTLQTNVRIKFTWEQAALTTIQAYQAVI